MSDFNHGILREVAHRPWPMPAGAWLMSQTWHDLLFAHWPVPHDRLRDLVPARFALDLFHGQARLAGVLPDRALLSVRGRPSVAPLPSRDPPSGLAARDRGRRDRCEHDGRRRRYPPAADGPAAPLLEAAGHGLLGAGENRVISR